MSTLRLGRSVSFGYGYDATNIGTAAAASIGGIPVLNQAMLDSGQGYYKDRRNTGYAALTTGEVSVGLINPTWTPEITCFEPFMGFLHASLLSKATDITQTGTGPYLQTITCAPTTGQQIAYGDTVAKGTYGLTLCEKLNLSGSYDRISTGGICTSLEVVIPETGRITVTPTIQFLEHDAAAAALGGTYALPSTTLERNSRSFQFGIGDGPGNTVALYSKELRFTISANAIARYYPGQGGGSIPGAFPFKVMLTDWSVTGTLMRPTVAGDNTWFEKYFYNGGTIAADTELFIWPTELADETTALDTAGQMAWDFNIRFDRHSWDLNDELTEVIEFEGVMDGVHNLWKFRQASTASQPWAA